MPDHTITLDGTQEPGNSLLFPANARIRIIMTVIGPEPAQTYQTGPIKLTADTIITPEWIIQHSLPARHRPD